MKDKVLQQDLILYLEQLLLLCHQTIGWYQNYQKVIVELKNLLKNVSRLTLKNKKGLNLNLFVEHPFIKNKKIIVFIANFVLTEYGLGAIFGCPAHDDRDLEFTKNII